MFLLTKRQLVTNIIILRIRMVTLMCPVLMLTEPFQAKIFDR